MCNGLRSSETGASTHTCCSRPTAMAASSYLTSMRCPIRNALEKEVMNVLKGSRTVLIFEMIVPFVGYKSWINPLFSSCWVCSSMDMMKAQEPRFTSFFTLLVLFRTHLHTSKTICPSIPLLGWALKNASVSISKVHSIPHSGGNFPEDVILFPPPSLSLSLSQTHMHAEAHACTRPLHACMHAYVPYLSLCWANTPLCLTCFLCHDDERHLLFSAETPLHPMLLTSCLHYSEV